MPSQKKLIFTAALTLSFLAGCASDKNEKKGKPAVSSPGGTSVRANAEVTPTPTPAVVVEPKALPKPTCENKIPLTAPGLTALEDNRQLPEGLWKLASIEFYSLQVDDNGSFSATASASENFSPKVDCTGLAPQKEGVESKLASDFSTAEWMNTKEMKTSPYLRKIRAEFVNGKLSTVSAGLDPNENQDMNEGQKGALDKVKVNETTLMSARRYMNTQNQIEIRVLMEFQKDGKTIVEQSSRAVFELNK